MKIFKKQSTPLRGVRGNSRTCPYACQIRGSKVKRNRYKLWGAALGVALILGASTYVVAFSDAFEIKSVKVAGEMSVNRESLQNEIEQVMQTPQGFLAGNNYFALNEKQITEKVLGAFPQIAEAKINKKFPAQLEVMVKEKESKVVWCRANCFLVSASGEAYMPVDNQNTRYIKIQEMEESDTTFNGSKDQVVSAENGLHREESTNATPARGSVQKEEERNEIPAMATRKPPGSLTDKTQTLAISASNAPVSNNSSRTIALKEQVTDAGFIQAILDISEKLSNNKKLQVEHFETSGTESRELILFSPKGTKVYFDTTKNLDIQMDNLNYLLQKELKPEEINGLRYIYLKNLDRIFYK